MQVYYDLYTCSTEFASFYCPLHMFITAATMVHTCDTFTTNRHVYPRYNQFGLNKFGRAHKQE